MLLTQLPHLLSRLITSLLTGFMISRRNVPGFQRMGDVFFGMAGYNRVAFLLKTIPPPLWEKIFWDTIEYAWLIQISISRLLFVVDYIELKIANPLRLYASLLIHPASISILLLTNDFKGGFRPDAVLTLDARDPIQDVNPAALVLSERTGQALINPPISILLGGLKDLDWVSHDQEFKFTFTHSLIDGRHILSISSPSRCATRVNAMSGAC